MRGSTALLTDRYELTMLQAALRDGTAARRCVFETFARRLPEGRRFGVVAGTGRLLELLADFRFADDELRYLRDERIVDATTVAFLEDFRFRGDVDGYREGEIFVPDSPVLTVTGTFAEAVLLETLVLSVLNHDSAIAAAAARMVAAAGDRPLIEMGSRRTAEESAVAAARAAWLTGFATTSNLDAGRRWQVPTAGTAAHAWTLLHDDEEEAFRAQIEALGVSTTLLVDTYDVPTGVARAVRAGGTALGGVRIDSGDLPVVTRTVRDQLDALGATATRITATGDLDEYAIAALATAPVDAYGVGTALVTGSGSPTAGMVYKLVAREAADGTMLPVAKRSLAKATRGGRKAAWRRLAGGAATAELLATRRGDPGDARPLQVRLVDAGDIGRAALGASGLRAARAHHRSAREELPTMALDLRSGEPAFPTFALD